MSRAHTGPSPAATLPPFQPPPPAFPEAMGRALVGAVVVLVLLVSAMAGALVALAVDANRTARAAVERCGGAR